MLHKVHTSTQASEADLARETAKAIENGSWMGVVVYLENGKLQLRKILCNFPEADQIKVLEELRKMLNFEMNLEQKPLPLAPHLVDFGDVEEGGEQE